MRSSGRLALPSAIALLLLSACGERAAPNAAATPADDHGAAIDWPMTRGGPALSGHVPARVPRAPAIAWTFKAAGPITAEAAIVGDRIFIGTEVGTLHCLAADTGREVWKFTSEDSITAAPAVDAERVYVSSNDGTLYALDRASGAERWRFGTEDKISAGATLVANPANGEPWVLVNGYDGTTRALRAADGTVVWSYVTEDFINGAPAVVDGRFVVFGGCDAKLHVVNLADGSPAQAIETDAQIPASIGTFGAMAFCGNYANQAVAFDTAAGTIAWVYQDRALPFFSSPAINDRLVLIGSRDKHLHAIDRATGEAVWKFRTNGRVEGSPIVFTDAVVFSSSDGRMFAADLAAGTEIWRLELGESLIASPAFGGGRLVVGGEQGTLFAIQPGPADGG